MNRLTIASIFALFLCLSSCATGTVNIPDNLSPAEIIQRAQEAMDKNRYGVALQYYEALRDRNLTNIDLICEAEYEIAFIYYKENKFAQAKEGFNDLLERYEGPEGENLPAQFKLLAGKVLESISEKETRRRTLFKRNSSD